MRAVRTTAAAAAARSLAPAVAVAAVFAAAVPAFAIPAGYFVDSTRISAHPQARRDLAGGDHSASLRRVYADSLEGRLLSIAEATFPPRDVVVGLAAAKGHELGADSAGAHLWWQDGIAESRVPYALTAAAVEHYLSLTALYRERRFGESSARPLFRSELVYRASIATRDTFVAGGETFGDVRVVALELTWTYDDGTFVPRVEARRTVVLTPRGDVLAVEGDGAARETVTMSTRRGIGREERIPR